MTYEELLAYNERLKARVAELDSQLSRKLCQLNRCVEYADLKTEAESPERELEKDTTFLIMCFIDRMDDPCPDVDPAEKILSEFCEQFRPLQERFNKKKFRSY